MVAYARETPSGILEIENIKLCHERESQACFERLLNRLPGEYAAQTKLPQFNFKNTKNILIHVANLL